MLHQDLAVLSRLQQLVVDQGVSIDDVVKGAIDLAIKAPRGGLAQASVAESIQIQFYVLLGGKQKRIHKYTTQ